jgi:hypothetical protein
VNSFYAGGKPGVSDTFASALWCLDYVSPAASFGSEGVNLETDVNQIAVSEGVASLQLGASSTILVRLI